MSDEAERAKAIDRRFEPYDYAGFIAPGAAFLLGLFYLTFDYWPGLWGFIKQHPDSISLGGLGMFVVLAYATGHVLEGCAIPIDWLMWQLYGGRPTYWIISGHTLLTDEQRTKLLNAANNRFDLHLEPNSFGGTVGKKKWDAVVRQIRAAVVANGRSGLVDKLHGNYGLTRGLAAASIILLIMAVVIGIAKGCKFDWPAMIVFFVSLNASLVRMWQSHRFHAMELYVEFLNLPPVPKR
jgi:hypothetical protein